MRWLSESVEALLREIAAQAQGKRAGEKVVLPAVVVGSGYGGAVSALRLAEKGYAPVVLERGEEYLPGEFPNDVALLPRHMRLERWNQGKQANNHSGLFDVRIGKNAGALVGNALGGTSQINANVVLRPDARVFTQACWPWELRKDHDPLHAYYPVVESMLEISPRPGQAPSAGHTANASGLPKVKSLEALAGAQCAALKERKLQTDSDDPDERHLSVQFEPAPIAVNTGGAPKQHLAGVPTDVCVGCGDCVSGCNYFAKNTLTTNYLPRARAAGARMFTGVSVLRVSRVPRGEEQAGVARHHRKADAYFDGQDTAQFCWRIDCVRTGERGDYETLRGKIPNGEGRVGHAEDLVFSIYAETLVIAAGTLGSGEIMQRSKAAGLPLSDTLGKRFSGNGDYLAYGYLQKDAAHAVGFGSRHQVIRKVVEDQGNGAVKVERPAADPAIQRVGPTIAGMIRIDDDTNVRNSTLIQDGSVPGAIAGMFHEMMSSMATLAQLDAGEMRHDEGVDPLTLQPRGLTHTQTLLALGHDCSAGELVFDEERDRLRIEWPQEDVEATYRRHDRRLRHIEKLGAIHLRNPAWQPLPASLQGVLKSPAMGGAMFTVHPLGGCAMGDDAQAGVVDDCGRVFNGDGPRYSVHPGLYVLDGSIVPASLGANPLLTISALAERAMRQVRMWTGPAAAAGALPAFPADIAPAPYANPLGDEVGIEFTEVLRGDVVLGGKLKDAVGCAEAAASLTVHLPIHDLREFFRQPDHALRIIGSEGIDSAKLKAALRVSRRPERPKYAKVESLKGDDKVNAREAGWMSPHGSQYETCEVQSGTVRIFRVQQPWCGCIAGAYVRTLWTWLVERGLDEGLRYLRDKRHPRGGEESKFAAGSLFKLARHAAEARAFDYDLTLKWEHNGAVLPLRLRGRKEFTYPAGWGALFKYAGKAIARRVAAWCGATPAPVYLQRRNVWTALGYVEIEADGAAGSVKGALEMDIIELARRGAPELKMRRDLPNALVAAAGYPLMFLRGLAKMRIWDFRLPDYPVGAPPADTDLPTAWPEFPPIRGYQDASGQWVRVAPEPSLHFQVRMSESEDRPITLGLTRYRARELETRPSADGRATVVKSIMLMNGFAQPTLAFVATELQQNMAEAYYQRGYDVWLFDYSSSTITDASKEARSLDGIALYDVPGALAQMQRVLRADLQGKVPDDLPLQVFGFAHCVGAAGLAMSVLAGKCTYGKKKGEEEGVAMFAGLSFSQMQMYLIGAKNAQARLQVAGLLRDGLGIKLLRLSATERAPDAFEGMLDRLFASFPCEDEERCPHEYERSTNRPGIATCKRMSGVLSRLLKHDQILEETHDRLSVYFGRANTTLLAHGGKCVENERLVDEDGQNVYVTDSNIRKHLRLPVAILHGTENVLFDFQSGLRTIQEIARVNGDDFARDNYRLIRAGGYAHFDCTIGKNAKDDIFKELGEFFDLAWQRSTRAPLPAPEAELPLRSRARAPLAGPVIGWTRPAAGGGTLMRLWMAVDENDADQARCVMTVLRAPNAEPLVQTWPVTRVVLCQPAFLWPGARRAAARSIALADVHVPAGIEGEVEIDMVSVHQFGYDDPRVRAPAEGPDRGLDAEQWNLQRIAPPIQPSQVAGKLATELGPLAAGKAPVAATTVTRPPRRAYAGGGLLGYWRERAQPRHGLRKDYRGMRWEQHRPDAGLAEEAAEKKRRERARWLDYLQRRRDYPAQWTARVRKSLVAHRDADGNIRPLNLQIGPAESRELLDTLARSVQATCELALSPAPGTLSRKLRSLPDGQAWTLRVSERARCAAQAGEGGALEANTLRFLAGTCMHPGLGVDGYRVQAGFRAVEELLDGADGGRDFMLMLGDQIYSDASAGVFDPLSPIEKLQSRYQLAFSLEGFRRVARRLPLYMVGDDHEITNNWTAESLDQGRTQRRLYAVAVAEQGAHQWAHSPCDLREEPGFNFSFNARGYDFLALDTRTQRRARGGMPAVLTQQQMDRLGQWLGHRKDDRKPKFIFTGSVIAPGFYLTDNADNWQMALAQRAAFFELVSRAPNVVLLSGDYHCAARARIEFSNGNRAYAVIAPALHAPMPFSNAFAYEVMKEENISFSSGSATVLATVEDNNGFADISVRPAASGGWEMCVGARTWCWEAESADVRREQKETYVLS